MAKKKKTTKRSPAAGKTSKNKLVAKKPTAKKATTKKVTQKTTRKKVAKKKTTQKAAATAKKKSAKKAITKKKATKKKTDKKKIVKKKVVKKTTAKKNSTKKSVTGKKTAAKKSAKKTTTTKKLATSKPSQPAKSPELLLEEAMDQDWTKAKLRKVKSGLSRKDMNYFKALLKEKLIEIVGNIRGMETTRSDALSDIAHMPLHMADVGSDNFEQEFTLGLMEWERKIFADIKDALMRIEEGIYGVCLDSGRPINRARLEAKPWAKYCIEVARLREKRGW